MKKDIILGLLGTLLLSACSREIILAAPGAAQFPDDPFEDPLGSELDAGGAVQSTDFYVAVSRALPENGATEENSRRAVIHRSDLDSAAANPIGTRGWRTPCKVSFSGSGVQEIQCVVHIEESELLQKGVKFSVNYPDIPQCAFGRSSPSWFYRYEPIILTGETVESEEQISGAAGVDGTVINTFPAGFQDDEYNPVLGDNDFQATKTLMGLDDGNVVCAGVYEGDDDSINCCTGTAFRVSTDLDENNDMAGGDPADPEVEVLEFDETDDACTAVHLKQGSAGTAYGRDTLFGIPQTKLYSFFTDADLNRVTAFELPPLVINGLVTFFSQLSANYFLPNVAGLVNWKREYLFPQAFRPPLNAGAFGRIDALASVQTSASLQMASASEAMAFSCNSFATPVRVVSQTDLDLDPIDLFVQPEGANCGATGGGWAADELTLTTDAAGNNVYGGALPANGYIYRYNRTASWGLNPEPFHTFTCTDSAANVTARIKVMVQEWNTVSEFSRFLEFTESPPVGVPGAVNPDEDDDPADNNLVDWADLKNHRVDGIQNGGMTTYPYRQPGFPDGTAE